MKSRAGVKSPWVSDPSKSRFEVEGESTSVELRGSLIRMMRKCADDLIRRAVREKMTTNVFYWVERRGETKFVAVASFSPPADPERVAGYVSRVPVVAGYAVGSRP